MLTPTYNLTATERVLPSLALDFTTGALDPRVTVTRALNTATRYNSSGLIEIANADLPRFDYSLTTLAPRGLLIEESRANAFSYSEQFNNAYWTKSKSTISADAAVSPDGNTTADKLIPNNGGNGSVARQLSLTASTTYTVSIFGKPSEFSALRILINNGANFGYVDYNLANGTANAPGGNLTAMSASVTSLPNSWYRLTFTFTAVNTAAASTHSFLCNSTGNGTSGLFIWGAQAELGAFATSYIPTTTTSLTRNADVVSMTGTNFSSWWQVTTGGMLVRARQSAVTGIRPWAHISDGTADNIISLRGNAANPELYIKATTDQAQIDVGTLAASTSYGLASAWNTNDCAAAINGGTAVVDTSATIPTVDRMLIGSDGANYLNGWVEEIAFWPQRIINAEVQAFSK